MVPIASNASPSSARSRRAPTSTWRGSASSRRSSALIVFGALRYDNFLSPFNVLTFLRYNSMFALIALGMALVIMTGGIDLSVGGTAAMASVVAALLSPYHWAAGLARRRGRRPCRRARSTASSSRRLRIQPFIATLATMLAAYGTGAASGRQPVGLGLLRFRLHRDRPGRFPRLPDPRLDRARRLCRSAGSRSSGIRSAGAFSPSATARRRPG